MRIVQCLLVLSASSLLAACQTGKHTVVQQGPTDPREIQAAGANMNQNSIRALAEAELSTRTTLVCLDTIIAEEAKRLGSVDKVAATWTVQRELYRAQVDFLRHTLERAASSDQQVDPQIGGVAVELAQLANAQSVTWLTGYRGRTDVQQELMDMRRRQPEVWTSYSASSLSAGERGDRLLEAVRRNVVYDQLVRTIVVQRGEKPDTMLWLSYARVAALHAYMFGQMNDAIHNGAVVPQQQIAAAIASGNATSWLITLRFRDVSEVVKAGYGTLNVADYNVMRGQDPFDPVGFATFRSWLTAKAPDQAAQIPLPHMRLLWAAFREQNPKAFTGGGERLTAAVPTDEDRQLVQKRTAAPKQASR